ncbi:MAG: DUF1134 domain-containing protein [Pseudomonadota bacterium]
MRTLNRLIAALAGAALATAPLGAQVRTVDPNTAIDADIATPPPYAAPSASAPAVATPPSYADPVPAQAIEPATDQTRPVQPDATTYERDDVLGAAERTFGKGAAGLAEIVEKTLKDQGRPSAYIAGSEGSGAVIVGLRYGSGMMSHKVEGQRKVHWTGPSVGFDLGGDANKVFILVYNLYDTEDIYQRFPAAEGRLYFIGGFAATYLRRGNIVLIPIRLGVGYRAGVNVGYLKLTKKGKWLPF